MWKIGSIEDSDGVVRVWEVSILGAIFHSQFDLGSGTSIYTVKSQSWRKLHWTHFLSFYYFLKIIFIFYF